MLNCCDINKYYKLNGFLRYCVMLNCFGINKYDKLHGFMMYGIMWVVGRDSCENGYSFQFSNVGSSDVVIIIIIWCNVIEANTEFTDVTKPTCDSLLQNQFYLITKLTTISQTRCGTFY